MDIDMPRKNPYYLKIVWSVEDKLPYIRIFDPISETILKHNLVFGSKMKIATGKIRHCTGHATEQGSFIQCQEEEKIAPGRSNSTCPTCQSLDPLHCRATCNGYRCSPASQTQKDICDTDNTVVYLTLIGSIVKVGVSTNPVRRWLEQGSDYSVIIWEGSGLLARKLEITISKFLKIPTVIRFSQKIKALKVIQESSVAKDQLLQLREHLYRNLPFPRSKDFTKEFYNLLSHQGPLIRSLVEFSPISQEITTETIISGEIGVIKGSMLVLKQQNSYYVYNLTQLKGWEVQDPSKVKRRQLKQKSLLDFT